MARKRRQRKSTEYSLPDALVRSVFLTAVTLFCFCSALWMLQDIFPDWVLSKAAAAWICGLTAGTVILYEAGLRALPRGRLLCGIFLSGVYAAVLIRFVRQRQTDFEDGACSLAVQFLEKFNKQMHTSFSVWHGKPELLGMSFSFLMLASVLGLLILTLLSGKRIFVLLLPLTVFLTELLIGRVPQWRGIAFFGASFLFLSADGVPGNGRRQSMLQADGGGRRIKGTLLQRWMPVFCLAASASALAAAGGIIFRQPADGIMKHAEEVQAFQRDLERDITEFAASFFVQRNEDITNSPRSYTGREILKITTDSMPKDDLYLKGFQGGVYESGRWSYDPKKFSDACKKAEIGVEEASGYLQKNFYEAFAFEGSDAGAPADYTIAYTGISGRQAYLPYTVNPALSEDGQRVRLSADVTMLKPRGRKQMQVRGWNHRMDMEAVSRKFWADAEADADEKDPMEWYYNFVEESYLTVPDGMPKLDEVFDSIIDPGTSYHFVISDDTGEIVPYITDRKTARAYTLRSIIKELRFGIYSSSFYIPGDYKSMYYRWNTASLIGALLRENLSYNLNPKAIADGEDAVRYFLLESHEGYCVHFASAAVFLLRELGVPARYASGYVAHKEDFHGSGKQYTASVKDWNAHAWVEIYLNQIGWVPVDVTPGDSSGGAAETPQAQLEEDTGTADTEAADTDTEDTEAEDTRTEEDTKAQEEETVPDESEDNTAAGSGQGGRMLRRILEVFGAACLVGLICLGIRRAVRSYHGVLTEEVRKGKYRNAVLRLNRRIYRRLLRRGKRMRRNMTDAQYEQALNQAFPAVSGEQWMRYMQIVKEAAFSGEELKQEDAFFCLDIYRKTGSGGIG